MKKSVILMAAILIFCSFSYADTSLQHNFEQGNQFYTDGDYARAITEYEKVINADYQSAELYYNLGNAYFREGFLGEAILNYTRALRLDPRDEDIKANLEFARQFAVDKLEVTEETILLDYINSFFDSFSINEITIIAFIFYLLTIIALLSSRIYKWIKVPSPLLVVILCLFVISSIFTAVKLDRDVYTRKAVIIAMQSEVKSGPGTDFETLFTAHAGLTLTIERQESGFYLVNFENRVKGWVDQKTISEI